MPRPVVASTATLAINLGSAIADMTPSIWSGMVRLRLTFNIAQMHVHSIGRDSRWIVCGRRIVNVPVGSRTLKRLSVERSHCETSQCRLPRQDGDCDDQQRLALEHLTALCWLRSGVTMDPAVGWIWMDGILVGSQQKEVEFNEQRKSQRVENWIDEGRSA